MSGKPKTPQASAVTIEAKAFHDLQQAEAKHRSAIENAIKGIYQSTPGGRYQSVNPAVRRTLGYASKQLLGKNVAELFHPDDLPAALEAFQRRLEHPRAPEATGAIR